MEGDIQPFGAFDIEVVQYQNFKNTEHIDRNRKRYGQYKGMNQRPHHPGGMHDLHDRLRVKFSFREQRDFEQGQIRK